MKKLTVVMAFALVLCLATSAFALTDIPAGHWAEEYLNRLVATDIILGFPDGTFVGDQGLTRYQAAAITARLMDWVMLTGGGTLDMDRVIKELEKRGLSGQQAEEVLIMIRALTLEFKDEIEALDERMTFVDEELMRMRTDILGILSEHYDLEFMVYKLALNVEDLEDRVAVLEGKKVDPKLPKSPYTFSLEDNFDLLYVETQGATAGTDIYKNPFAVRYEKSANTWVKDLWAQGYDFENTLGMGIKAERDDFTANLNINAVLFAYGDPGTTPGFTTLGLESITGAVKTDYFNAKFDTDLRIMLKPYAFGLVDYRGMDLSYDKGLLVIGTDGTVGTPNFLAYTYGYDLFDFIDGRLFFTSDDVLSFTGQQYVVGLENNFSVAGLGIETEVAFSDVKDLDTLFAKVAAEYDIPAIMDMNLRAEYQRVGSTFAPLRSDSFFNDTGFRVDLSISPLGADVEAWYQSYATEVDKVGGKFAYEAELGIFNTEFGVTYDQDLDSSVLYYHDRLASLGLDISKIADLTVKYSFADGSAAGLTDYEATAHHAVSGQLNIKPFEYLTVTANARYGLGAGGTLTHNYKAVANWNFLSADVAKYFGTENSAIVANVAVDPSFDILGYTVTPRGSFGLHTDVDGKTTGAVAGRAIKYMFGVGLERNVTEALVWDGNYKYEVKQEGIQGYSGTFENLAGKFTSFGTGFTYNDWANLKAEVGNFTHDSDANQDYQFKVIKGGIKLTF